MSPFPSPSSAAARFGRAAALLLILAAPASALASIELSRSDAAPPRLRGDLNGDGAITSVDALAVLYQAVGKPLPAGFAATPYGDVNCDQNVTALDALVILNRSVGRDVSRFCIGQAVLPPVRISAAANRLNATAGDSVRFVATALDSAGNAVRPAELVWISSDTTLAVVDSAGLVRTRSRGDVQITVAWVSDPSVRTVVVLPIFTALPASTEVIDSTKARLVSDSAALASGTYIFQLSGANPPTISPGDVIVGAQGNGFLRRVQSVEVSGSQVVAHTSEASLTDAIAEGSFSVRTRLTLGSAVRMPTAGASVQSLSDPLCLSPFGVHAADATQAADAFRYDLSGTVLYQAPGITVTIPNGSITFDPELDVGADWGPTKGFEFHAIAGGSLSLDADVQVVATRLASYDRQTGSLVHLCKRFDTVIGSVPVTGRVELDVYALLHVGGSVVGTVKTGATSTASVNVGTRYKDGNWSGVGDASLNNSAHPFTWNITGNAEIRVTLKPVLTIYLYDVAGPRLGVLPYAVAEAGINSTNWKWRYRLGYGLDFELGATAKVLRHDLASWTHQFTGPSGTIAQDSGFLAIDSLRIAPGPVDTLDAYGLMDLTARAYVADQIVEGTPTWSSSNPSVAAVNDHGGVTALSQGTTYIRAAALTKRDSVKVVVISRSTLSKVSGDRQTGLPGSVLPDDIVVKARTPGGVGIPGVPVVFTVTGGGGSVSQGIVNTDGNGLAAVRWTLGPGEGEQTIDVSARDLGLVTFTATSTTDTIPVPETRPLSGGTSVTCALQSTNVAVCWGLNHNGELGDGTREHRDLPGPVSGDLRFATLGGSAGFMCGLTTGGKAYCWGDSSEGQLGAGDKQPSLVPVPVSTDLLFTHMASSGHTCAIATTGDSYCWGWPVYGQLGNGSENAPPVPVRVETSLRFVQLVVASSFSCGRTAEGEVYCWGMLRKGMGATSAPDTCFGTSGVRVSCAFAPIRGGGGRTYRTIAASADHACGIDVDGVTYCWGETPGTYVGTNYGLGDGTDTQSAEPVRVAGNFSFKSLSLGIHTSCGLTTDGLAYCWGNNYWGQLGDGTRTTALTPVPVSGGHRFVYLHTGGIITCGVRADGALFCWGSIDYGRGVGNGAAAGGSVVPVRVENLVIKVP